MPVIPNNRCTSRIAVANFAAMGTQNPIPGFIHGLTTGVDWLDLKTSGGIAWADSNFTTSHYDDATMVWPGLWSPNQRVEALVKSINQQDGVSNFQEVELRLRTTITANSITGYEFNWACMHNGNHYHQIGQWLGPIGVFGGCALGCAFEPVTNSIDQRIADDCKDTVAATAAWGSAKYGGLYDGDTVGAQIIGNHITSWIIHNGIKVILQDFFDTGGAGGGAKFTGRNADGSTQNPGIGHWNRGAGTPSDCGHVNAVATEL